MKHPSTPLLLSALMLSGCLQDPESGVLYVCADGIDLAENETGLSGSGTVTAIDAAEVDCSRSVTIEDQDGASITLGFTLEDADGVDISPAFDLAEEDSVDFTYRYRMVWGTVSGLVISDSAGLVLAAEQGGWGGALEEGDLDGVEVSRGDEVVASTFGNCQPLEGHEIHFEADDALTLTPVSSDEVTVDGQTLTATAVRATSYGESRTCQTTDVTDVTSWMLVR